MDLPIFGQFGQLGSRYFGQFWLTVRICYFWLTVFIFPHFR